MFISITDPKSWFVFMTSSVQCTFPLASKELQLPGLFNDRKVEFSKVLFMWGAMLFYEHLTLDLLKEGN